MLVTMRINSLKCPFGLPGMGVGAPYETALAGAWGSLLTRQEPLGHQCLPPGFLPSVSPLVSSRLAPCVSCSPISHQGRNLPSESGRKPPTPGLLQVYARSVFLIRTSKCPGFFSFLIQSAQRTPSPSPEETHSPSPRQPVLLTKADQRLPSRRQAGVTSTYLVKEELCLGMDVQETDRSSLGAC